LDSTICALPIKVLSVIKTDPQTYPDPHYLQADFYRTVSGLHFQIYVIGGQAFKQSGIFYLQDFYDH
jgi:hypothetical protein